MFDTHTQTKYPPPPLTSHTHTEHQTLSQPSPHTYTPNIWPYHNPPPHTQTSNPIPTHPHPHTHILNIRPYHNPPPHTYTLNIRPYHNPPPHTYTPTIRPYHKLLPTHTHRTYPITTLPPTHQTSDPITTLPTPPPHTHTYTEHPTLSQPSPPHTHPTSDPITTLPTPPPHTHIYTEHPTLSQPSPPTHTYPTSDPITTPLPPPRYTHTHQTSHPITTFPPHIHTEHPTLSQPSPPHKHTKYPTLSKSSPHTYTPNIRPYHNPPLPTHTHSENLTLSQPPPPPHTHTHLHTETSDPITTIPPITYTPNIRPYHNPPPTHQTSYPITTLPPHIHTEHPTLSQPSAHTYTLNIWPYHNPPSPPLPTHTEHLTRSQPSAHTYPPSPPPHTHWTSDLITTLPHTLPSCHAYQNMSHRMTKPTKWPVRSDCNLTTQSDQSLCCPHEETLGRWLPIKGTAKTDQTGRMPSLCWAHVILLVLTCGSSFQSYEHCFTIKWFQFADFHIITSPFPAHIPFLAYSLCHKKIFKPQQNFSAVIKLTPKVPGVTFGEQPCSSTSVKEIMPA